MKILFGETPCNPLCSILDLEEFGKLGRQFEDQLVTMVDTTYATPYLLTPIKYGIDVVLHSGLVFRTRRIRSFHSGNSMSYSLITEERETNIPVNAIQLTAIRKQICHSCCSFDTAAVL